MHNEMKMLDHHCDDGNEAVKNSKTEKDTILPCRGVV